jgi:hypothetical protein
MLGSYHNSVGLGTLWTNEDFGLPRVTGLHRQGQIPSQGRHICSSVDSTIRIRFLLYLKECRVDKSTHLAVILNLKIFISWLFNRFHIMEGTPRPYRIDSACFLIFVCIESIFVRHHTRYTLSKACGKRERTSALTPGVTAVLPDASIHPCLSVVIKFICCCLLRNPVLNVLVLHLFDNFDNVAGH